MDGEVGTVLMHRQAPVAFGVLASCAVIASGSILLREQILSFSSWPEAGGGGDAPEIAIPNVRPLALRDARGGEAGGGHADGSGPTHGAGRAARPGRRRRHASRS